MKITKSNFILILIVSIFLIIIISLSYLKFLKYKSNIINNIDKELFIAALNIPNILNDNFHDRAFYKDSVSIYEDSLNILKLSEINNKTSLKYLYTVIYKDNHYYITSSSATDSEIANNKKVHFFSNYDDAYDSLKNAFTRTKPSYFTNHDRWGSYRTVAIPMLSKNGNKYLSCADIDLNYVEDLLKINIIDFLIDISILIAFTLFTFFLYFKNNLKYTKKLQNEIYNRKIAEINLQKTNENLENLIEKKTHHLKQSEKNFQTIFNIIDDLIFVIDDKGIIISLNQTAVNKLKYSGIEIIGHKITDFQSEYFTSDFLNQLENIENQKQELISYPFITKNKEILYLEAKIIKSYWDNNDAFFFIAKDISDIKLSEEKFSTAFDANPTAMAISDLEQSMLLDVNESFVQIFGYLQIDIVGKSISDLDILVNPEQRNEIKELLLKNGNVKNYELDVKHKCGKIIKGIFYADIIIIQGRKCVLMVLNDITERKIAEELLKQKINEINALISTVPAYIYFKDNDLKYITINKSFSEMLNISIDEVAGKTDFDFYPKEIAEKRTKIEKDLILNDKPLPNYEEQITCLDGISRWITTNRVVFHDKEGNVAGLVGTIMDISKTKQTEVELSDFSEELSRSNKELEQFAYIASHDLQEPLRKVIAFGDRLKNKYSDKLDDVGNDYIERMNSASIRMQKMINDLLTYSRVSTNKKSFIRIDLNKIIRDVISDLEIPIEKTKANIQLSELPIIDGDPTQITQLMNNLIANALKYHKKDEQVNIHIYYENPEKNKIKIYIIDNGIGFENEFAEQIFKPFMRLHGRSEYEGNGIGLAICKKITERHKGHIKAEAEPGKGSKFIIELPINQHYNN